MAKSSNSDHELRESLRAWLRKAIRHSGHTPTEVARMAGLSSTTLTRPVKPGPFNSKISTDTIARVAEVTGYSPPELMTLRRSTGAAKGFRESDAIPYDASEISDHELESGQDWWMIKSRALDLEGYMPRDLVKVDINEPALAGDIVVAQISGENGDTTTVFRKFEPPFLVTRSTQPEMGKPVLVDYDRVVIMGVVVMQRRDRQRHAA